MRMIDEDKVGSKETPQDTRYIKNNYIKLRPEEPGVRAKELESQLLPLLGLRTRKSAGASSLRAHSGCVKCPGQVGPTTGCCGSPPPPQPKEEVFKVFEPKRVDSFLYTMIYFFNHGTQTQQWGANCPLCSAMSSKVDLVLCDTYQSPLH